MRHMSIWDWLTFIGLFVVYVCFYVGHPWWSGCFFAFAIDFLANRIWYTRRKKGGLS